MQVTSEYIISDVEKGSPANLAGIPINSRLVEICSQPVIVLTHEELLMLLKTTENIKALIIKPDKNGEVRR